MSGVRRFRRKPDPGTRADQWAAKYEPGQPLDDLAAVARMADPDAELAEATFPSGSVLIVRYARLDGPLETAHQVIIPGWYLAYSGGNGFLYDATDGDWRQFYDPVEEQR